MAPKIKRYADSTEVREWALSLTDKEKKDHGIEGIEVSNRGRFHSDIVRAFNRVHRNDGVRYVPIGRTQPRRDDVFEDADKGDDDRPTTYRQPRQQPKEAEVHDLPQQATLGAPQPLVMAMPGAPEPVMELLRAGHNVIVVYVPLPMQMAV